MKTVLIIAWILALGASLWFAGSAWRTSKPFASVRWFNPFGADTEQPRAMVWAPAGILVLFGAGMLRALVLHAHWLPAAALAFMIVWMALLVGMSWMLGRALKRGREGTNA